jgi:hypothetical protein
MSKYTIIDDDHSILYRKHIASLQEKLAEANEDAERLADELKVALIKTGVAWGIVWEEAGEDSPALIQHYQRLRA